MSEETTPATTPTTPEQSGMDPMMQAVWQLRVLVCGLGAALLVLSVTFNLFVWKQNRNIVAVTNARIQQLTQLDSRVKQLTRVVSDFGSYSEGKPELMAIFTRYGLELKTNAPAVKPLQAD
jgi:hypothetical protein